MLEYILAIVSRWAMPFFIIFVITFAIFKKVKIFEIFAEGAKEGFQVAIKLIPYIVGLFVATALFRDSGALELFIKLLQPLLALIGVPGEVVPIFILRPLSGSVALAMTIELFYRLGADSFASRLASTIYGSADTTFYIVSVYFASIGIKRFRYALWVGLLGNIAGFLAAVFIANRVF